MGTVLESELLVCGWRQHNPTLSQFCSPQQNSKNKPTTLSCLCTRPENLFLPLLQLYSRAWLGHCQAWGRTTRIWLLTKRPLWCPGAPHTEDQFAFLIRTKQSLEVQIPKLYSFWDYKAQNADKM